MKIKEIPSLMIMQFCFSLYYYFKDKSRLSTYRSVGLAAEPGVNRFGASNHPEEPVARGGAKVFQAGIRLRKL